MLAASSFSSLAQSTQDLSIARRSAAIFDTAYRKTGMSGINTRVQECYAKAKARKSEALVEQCFILDFDRAPGGGVGARGRSCSPADLAGYVRRPRRAA